MIRIVSIGEIINHLTPLIHIDKTNEDSKGAALFDAKGMQKAEDQFDELSVKIDEQYCNATQAAHNFFC
jgi:hypothetical protein